MEPSREEEYLKEMCFTEFPTCLVDRTLESGLEYAGMRYRTTEGEVPHYVVPGGSRSWVANVEQENLVKSSETKEGNPVFTTGLNSKFQI